MKFSESIKNISEALCKVQAEIKNPIKTAVNKGVQGAPKYALLEDTLDDIRPVLAKHGMAFTQNVTGDGAKVGVSTVLFHSSGEYIESDMIYCDIEIPLSREGKKILTPGQATGVNITYLRRYSLNSTLGITGDADTDGSLSDIPAVTQETAKDFEITFGKHKGKTISEVYEEAPGYIDWIMGSDKADPELKKAITLMLNEQPKEPKKPKEPKEKPPICSICKKEMDKKIHALSIKKFGRSVCSLDCKEELDKNPDKYPKGWVIESESQDT